MTLHMEERKDKKELKINFLEMERTKKGQGTWEMARRIAEKSNIYHPGQAKNVSLSDFFLLLHFDITSLSQAPSLPVLCASDMPLLSQYWSSSQARLAKYQSQICSHLFELLEHINKKSCYSKTP